MYYEVQVLFPSAQVNSILFSFLSEAHFGILLFYKFCWYVIASDVQLLENNYAHLFSP